LDSVAIFGYTHNGNRASGAGKPARRPPTVFDAIPSARWPAKSPPDTKKATLPQQLWPGTQAHAQHPADPLILK
jgi:hypothetical protein